MPRIITKEEVKKHDNEQSVWMIIHNIVYDVTLFLDEHPGGPDSLLDYAGQDGTQAFEDIAHSEDARIMMKKYKIGKLPAEERTKQSNKCTLGSQTQKRDCVVYQAASCPSLPKNASKDKSWRTFDGTTDRPKSPKSDLRPPAAPTVERRVQNIVVPRQSRPREHQPCQRRRPREPPCQGSSKLKWALLLLGAAIIIGIVVKKYK